MQERFRARRAARHVDVGGDELVDALGHRVGVPVRPPAVGAGAVGDDVLGVGHLFVHALERGGHLVRHRAGDHEEVGLARAVRERDDAVADEVVLGGGGGDELDGAAGQPEVEDPQAVAAPPVEDEPNRFGHDLLADAYTLDLHVYTHVSTPLRQA